MVYSVVIKQPERRPMAEYVNNAAFTAAISKYRLDCAAAEAAGLERPVIPNDIAASFLKIATKLSYRYNFLNYSYREEFVSEGAMACCNKILNFDPSITTNAFGYFTRICFYSFVEVIESEHKEAYVKAKSYYNSIEENGNPFETGELDGDHDIESDFIPYFDVQQYEKKQDDRRSKSKKTKVTVEAGNLFE